MSTAASEATTPEVSAPLARNASTGRQVIWNFATFGLSKTLALIMTVIVARLLNPSDFGLFALALLVLNAFDYVKDLGVSAAMVQSPEPWNRLAPSSLTLSVIFGVASGGSIAAIAPLAAMALHNPELTALLRVLAVGLAVTALSIVPAARLRRDLDFRRRLWPESLSAAVKAVLTIVFAAEGLGVWSLAYGQLAGALTLTGLYWWFSRTPVRFGFDRRQARSLLRYGIPHSAATLIAFAIYNVDYLAIGIQLGNRELGIYTIAYRLPELLVLNLCVVISEVLFSTLSRLQHAPSELAQQYLRVTVVTATLSAPVGSCLAAAAPEVVETLYGPAYSDAGPVLAVLAVYALLYSASWHAGDVFKAMGRPSLLAAIGGVKLVVMVGPIWWAAGNSIVAVGLVLLAVEVVSLGVNLVIASKLAGLSLAALAKATLQPVPAAASAAAVIMGIRPITAGMPGPLGLCIDLLAGLPIYAAALRFTARDAFHSVLAVVQLLRHFWPSEGAPT